MNPSHPQKLEVAYHEAGHAVMGLLYGLRITKSSLIGTAAYRGVTSFEPFERKDTFEHAEREIRLNLAGFVGEGLFSGNKIKIEPPHHPELTDSIKIFRDLQSDEGYRNFANGLPDLNPGALPMIKDPVVRVYISHMLATCFSKMILLKSAVKAIADELHEKDELTGDEISAIYKSCTQISFQDLTQDHIPLLQKWLREPHVSEFWQETEDETELKNKFLKKLQERGVRPYAIYFGKEPIGYIQDYDANLVGGGWWPDATPGTFGVDQFIGEPSLVGKGLGTVIIRQFVQRILDNPLAKEVITDPDPKNLRAIRAYEKVGFKKVGEIQTPGGAALLMKLNRTGEISQ